MASTLAWSMPAPLPPRMATFSPQVQLPVNWYPAAVMRSPGELPPAPVCERVWLATIQSLWALAASISRGLKARGCFAAVSLRLTP